MRETYLNKPPKGCKTCLFREGDKFGAAFWKCGKSGGLYCSTVRTFHSGCDENFSGWMPKPPRRSVRQWIHDTFLA